MVPGSLGVILAVQSNCGSACPSTLMGMQFHRALRHSSLHSVHQQANSGPMYKLVTQGHLGVQILVMKVGSCVMRMFCDVCCACASAQLVHCACLWTCFSCCRPGSDPRPVCCELGQRLLWVTVTTEQCFETCIAPSLGMAPSD